MILDLEDAVAAVSESRRPSTLSPSWLRRKALEGPSIQVRVNAGADHEVAALRADRRRDRAAGAEGRDDASTSIGWPTLAGDLPHRADRVRARGGERGAIAAHPAVTRIALGESDLASDLGTKDATVLDYARLRLVFAARAAGLPAPMLSAYPDIRDLDGLRATPSAAEARLVGRVAVHPTPARA